MKKEQIRKFLQNRAELFHYEYKADDTYYFKNTFGISVSDIENYLYDYDELCISFDCEMSINNLDDFDNVDELLNIFKEEYEKGYFRIWHSQFQIIEELQYLSLRFEEAYNKYERNL